MTRGNRNANMQQIARMTILAQLIGKTTFSQGFIYTIPLLSFVKYVEFSRQG